MSTIRIGHSPDPDDAFMFYALTHGKLSIPGVMVEHVLEDIESLNRRARTGELVGLQRIVPTHEEGTGCAGPNDEHDEDAGRSRPERTRLYVRIGDDRGRRKAKLVGPALEVTAISAATYPLVADRYRIMDPGASMGKGYGPILVAKAAIDSREIPNRVVAIPGSHTTAALLLRLYCGAPPIIEVPFDKIPRAVLEEQAELGLLIHEGQITHEAMGLRKVLDLGERWERDTTLPLPLGINVMRRDLGEDLHRSLSAALSESIAYAHAHVDEALDYAMQYGRGIDRETCRRFVLMYVNDYTVTLGEAGRQALHRLYEMAHQKGLIPEIPPIDPI